MAFVASTRIGSSISNRSDFDHIRQRCATRQNSTAPTFRLSQHRFQSATMVLSAEKTGAVTDAVRAPTGLPPPPVSLKAIFFDLDGTCVNSDHIHFETYRDTLQDLAPAFNDGEAITRELYDREMAGWQNPELVARILPKMPEAERTALWQEKERRYEDVIMSGAVPPVAGLVDVLKTCVREQVLHWVVTNAPKGSCHKTMTAIGIALFFDSFRHVVVAEECAHPKPAPDPYLAALKRTGTQARDAIVFEDSPSGVRAATAAGVYTIGIRSTQTHEALTRAGAAFTISDYTDVKLAEFLQRYNLTLRN